MSATVTIRKIRDGRIWEIPSDHPLLPQVFALSKAWGLEVVDDVDKAAPAGAVEVRKGGSMNGSKQVIKAAVEGDVAINRTDLLRAVQKRADKEIDAPTPEQRVARYLEKNAPVRIALDAA